MKRSQTGYLITIGALFFLALGAAGGWGLKLWLDSQSASQTDLQKWLPFVVLLVLLLAMGFLLNRFVQAYFYQVRDLNSQARLILNVNPVHRVKVDGAPAVRDLGATINTFGDEFQSLLADRDAQVSQATADLKEERNLLAALLSELTDGVLACNRDGQILLYNRSARQLLNQLGDADGAGGYVGLGRSLFGLLDRSAITHALDRLRYRVERNASGDDHVVSFVTAAANGRMVRVRITEFSDDHGITSGFILTVRDMTQSIESSSRRDFMLQTFTEGVRTSLASIRAAIETIEAFPDMDQHRRHDFHQIIGDEAQKLSMHFDTTMRTHARDLKAQWRLEAVHGIDLLWAIAHHIGQELDVQVELDEVNTDLWLNVDSYELVHGLTTVVRDLQAEVEASEIHLRLLTEAENGQSAALDMLWDAGGIDPAAWRTWSRRAFVVDEGDATLTLKEVADRHGGEVWFQIDEANASATVHAYFRLLLPLVDGRVLHVDTERPALRPSTIVSPRATRPDMPAENAGADAQESGDDTSIAPRVDAAGSLVSRPEYYDFNLFHQPGQTAELDEHHLSTLSYTVFDTETTGLNPTRDEIISIGAIRIVNGRALRQEIFDQLIDPQRGIPPVSTSVHGISNAMVKGQPNLIRVLPRFNRFAEETVLVAHNAAFDMRMFQVKEEATGVKFVNPVLDTLLLSAVVHPDENDHSLEAIAKRLGIDVTGRHTALGDALVTADVFLGLLRLLADQGIVTLQQAREAAEKTYLARIKY